SVFRPSILKLTAYSSARSLTQNTGTLPSQYMDANELAVTPTLSTNLAWENTLNRYPSPQPIKLLEAFSQTYQVPLKNILITRGSDEAIDILTRAVCEAKTIDNINNDTILIMPPTYGMYEVSADIQNTAVVKVPLLLKDDEWSLDLENIKLNLDDEKSKVKIVYVCSPNNPTGTVFHKKQIIELLESLPKHTLLVLDQAYFEFTNDDKSVELLNNYPQLVILRTLSKAWGLAGLRCGVLLGNDELVSVLQKVRAPYPTPTPVAELALMALTPSGQQAMRERVSEVIEERENLKAQLLQLPQTVRIYPSATNFLLVEFTNTSLVMSTAAKNGIVLRDRSSQISNCVRITIGSKEENIKLLNCLQKMNPQQMSSL
ncbi:histidinol-phosphate transaminase, partial [bacterium]|nr:histidinol-phosphate transaminase [bacterium]